MQTLLKILYYSELYQNLAAATLPKRSVLAILIISCKAARARKGAASAVGAMIGSLTSHANGISSTDISLQYPCSRMGENEDSTWSPIRDPNNPLPPPCSLTKHCEGKLRYPLVPND
eukprot:g47614.t1